MPFSNKVEVESLAAIELSVGFPHKLIAEALDINIAKGQISVIAGPNGAGKSTLIKTLARQLAPLKGQVMLDGINIATLSASQFARTVAYVPQLLELEQNLTVSELVMLGRNPHQAWWSWSASKDDRQAVSKALELTGTTKLSKSYLSSLSGGERQRAIIACALAQNAQFILLDEPTAHLDFRHQLELSCLLKELCNQHLGILVVLHDLNLIAQLAHQVFLLDQTANGISHIVASGTPEAVLEPNILRQVYQVEVSICVDEASGSRVYTPMRCLTSPKPLPEAL